ncbi:hypothetical protein H4R20_005704, partial [Coemansia guatemalensis]
MPSNSNDDGPPQLTSAGSTDAVIRSIPTNASLFPDSTSNPSALDPSYLASLVPGPSASAAVGLNELGYRTAQGLVLGGLPDGFGQQRQQQQLQQNLMAQGTRYNSPAPVTGDLALGQLDPAFSRHPYQLEQQQQRQLLLSRGASREAALANALSSFPIGRYLSSLEMFQRRHSSYFTQGFPRQTSETMLVPNHILSNAASTESSGVATNTRAPVARAAAGNASAQPLASILMRTPVATTSTAPALFISTSKAAE